MQWRGVHFEYHCESDILDSYASTTTRLGDWQFEAEKKAISLYGSLVKSQHHINEACTRPCYFTPQIACAWDTFGRLRASQGQKIISSSLITELDMQLYEMTLMSGQY